MGGPAEPETVAAEWAATARALMCAWVAQGRPGEARAGVEVS